MKKIISIALTLSVIASFMTFSLTAKADYAKEEGIISLLNALEIMQGDEDGDMALDRKVSRAEFAKIAIASSSAKNSVAFGLNMSPYRDVPYTEWFAPYVQAAVTAGYVKGYLDSTYRPYNTVTYEEAVTMMLRVLGYDDSGFAAAYPYGQIAKAQDVDILDDVDGQIGAEMTRRQVMYLVYNALGAKTAGNDILINSHDCAAQENADVISTSEQDDTLGKDKVFTSAGTYTKGDYFNESSVGMEGTAYIKNSKELIAFVPDDKTDNGYEKYVVYSVLPDAVVGYRNGRFENIDIPEYAAVYKNQSPTTYQAVKNSFEMGDLLYVKRTNGGSVDYVSYKEGNLEGPVCVRSTDWISAFNTNAQTTVMRSGNKVNASDIQINDIIYYSEDLNMVLAYTDKVTGVYEKASPTKDSPTSVTVSGKEYSIESVDAFNDLSSSGQFKYGDTITVLLGRDGEIAAVAGGSISQGGIDGGFVIEAGKKDFTNADNTVYSSYYVKIVSPDGIVNEYAVNSDCASMVCQTVRVTFKDGKASLTRSNMQSSLSGKVNASKMKIGDTDIAEDVKILDTSGTYSDDEASYCRIYPQRIDGVTLGSSNVLYYSKNSSGEVDELILKDVTGDTYTYGIIVNVDKSTGAYKIDVDGTQSTYPKNGFASDTTGPHRLRISNAGIESMQPLTSYPASISSLTRTEAQIGSQKYLLSDKVVVYHKTSSSSYMKIPLDEAISGDYRLTAYYDKAQSSGGRIRIIIAQ